MFHKRKKRFVEVDPFGSHKKLQLFVNEQRSALDNVYHGLGRLHYNAKDAEIIDTWSNRDSNIVWEKLVKYCGFGGEDGLDFLTSPFCIYQQYGRGRSPFRTFGCSNCRYGWNHDWPCQDTRSDSRLITIRLWSLEILPSSFLSTAYYGKILSEIEENN